MTIDELLEPFRVHPLTPSFEFFGGEGRDRQYTFESAPDMKGVFAQLRAIARPPLSWDIEVGEIELIAEDGTPLLKEFRWTGVGDIKIIGMMFHDDAVIEGDEMVSPHTPKPGWHVNILPSA